MARRKTSRSRPQQRKKTSKSIQKPKEPLLSGVSPQRRIDIFGVIILLIGSLTLISLFTRASGSVTGWWVRSLSLVMGWGVYILPFALIVLGASMLFRNIEKLPKITIERTVGIFLLFINLVTWFHLIIDGGVPEAQAGLGGGYIGALIKLAFVRTLGTPGTIVVLVAWLLICLILTLDLSMAAIVKALGDWLNALGKHLQRGISIISIYIQKKLKPPLTETSTKPPQSIAPASNEIKDKSLTGAEITANQDNQESPIQEPVWVLPNPAEILEPASEPIDDEENDQHRARVIEETLRSFGAPAHVVDVRRGPAVTMFGVEPDFVPTRNGKTRVRVSKITALSDDLALALAAARIRIQAPVPGKGYIGIEVPNRHTTLVSLQDVMSSAAFENLNSPLKIALGKDVSGNPVAADLTAMPHLLIAGTTGAGKSVCINDILTCFLLSKTPDELRMILIDPKRVELSGYNGIPHLLAPVIVDVERVVGALQWMMREMENRYRKFSECNTRNIADYNIHCENTNTKKLPYILVVIDELSDLMMMAPDETERAITRLAQLARATGIHLIIATQRPSTDILTGLIKANFPARIAFAVASSVDSRVILDQPGAERLLGKGDMLFQAPDAPAPVRIQSVFVSDQEIYRLTAYWRAFTVSGLAPERPDQSAAFQAAPGVTLKQTPLWDEVDQDLDSRFDDALLIVKAEGQASVSMLQRKMRIGYTRAARIIEKMEEKGIVSAPDPKTQVRQVLSGSASGDK